MRVLIQRVRAAQVCVEGAEQPIGRIGTGLLLLICAMPADTPASVQALAQKIARLRLFRDDAGKMNLNITQVGGAALAVSQFTLAADTRRGNRPGFSGAARPEAAQALFDGFVAALRDLGIETATGQFGAEMQVTLTNDGPVTIWIDSDD